MHQSPRTAVHSLICLTAIALLAGPHTHAADPTPTPQPAPPPAEQAPAVTTQPAPPTPTTQPAAPAATPDDKPGRKRIYVDEDYDFSVEAPAGWMRSSTSGITVAGNLCRVWSPNAETGALVFRSPSIDVMTPLQIADSTTESMVARANAEVHEQAVRTIDGKKAAIVLLVGRGTQSGIDGQGNLRIAQYMAVIPRTDDMIVCMLITPEEQLDSHRSVFEHMLDSMKVGGEQTEAQKRD